MKTLCLGIETSCDDTSLCLLEHENGTSSILSFKTFSQETILREWGGVVPEIASRNHLEKLLPLLKQVFEDAQRSIDELKLISVTTHPGLLGPLLTGLNMAKTLALFTKASIVPANHLMAHLEAIGLTQGYNSYPYLGVLVSGGHTLFAKVTGPLEMEILGTTLDDAAGEAFDKGGKLLGLGYPAGRIIDLLAGYGNKEAISFPIGLKDKKTANLSYSGVKTQLRNYLEKNPELILTPDQRDLILKDPSVASQEFKDVCASYQHAIVNAIILKLKMAFELNDLKELPIVVGGGVACNRYLRIRLKENFKNVSVVEPKYCTDNGAMIAHYGCLLQELAIPFPKCLGLDARDRIISKRGEKENQLVLN